MEVAEAGDAIQNAKFSQEPSQYVPLISPTAPPARLPPAGVKPPVPPPDAEKPNVPVAASEEKTASSVVDSVIETAPKVAVSVLKLIGAALTVYGAHNQAAKSAKEQPDAVGATGAYLSTFIWAVPAGLIDDAFAVDPPTMGWVGDSWEHESSGPAQAFVGEVMRDFFRSVR